MFQDCDTALVKTVVFVLIPSTLATNTLKSAVQLEVPIKLADKISHVC
jgi:hypothetical protein